MYWSMLFIKVLDSICHHFDSLKIITKVSMSTKSLWCFFQLHIDIYISDNLLMIGQKPESNEVISDLLHT